MAHFAIRDHGTHFGWLAGWRKLSGGETMKTIHRQFVDALCALKPAVSVAQRLIKAFPGFCQCVGSFDRRVASFGTRVGSRHPEEHQFQTGELRETASLGAALAVIVRVFAAFLLASRAQGGTDVSQLRRELAASRRKSSEQPTQRAAFQVQRDAVHHVLDVGLEQTGTEATVARIGTCIARFDAAGVGS